MHTLHPVTSLVGTNSFSSLVTTVIPPFFGIQFVLGLTKEYHGLVDSIQRSRSFSTSFLKNHGSLDYHFSVVGRATLFYLLKMHIRDEVFEHEGMWVMKLTSAGMRHHHSLYMYPEYNSSAHKAGGRDMALSLFRDLVWIKNLRSVGKHFFKDKYCVPLISSLTGTSFLSRQLVDTSLIHIESRMVTYRSAIDDNEHWKDFLRHLQTFFASLTSSMIVYHLYKCYSSNCAFAQYHGSAGSASEKALSSKQEPFGFRVHVNASQAEQLELSILQKFNTLFLSITLCYSRALWLNYSWASSFFFPITTLACLVLAKRIQPLLPLIFSILQYSRAELSVGEEDLLTREVPSLKNSSYKGPKRRSNSCCDGTVVSAEL
ncbi:hypothetical protein Tco_0860508 [Tanacetum coccineum]|uniref:Uncharacterized protein n=1 Tax=Tanacetum coccineum TaxID=301880 RepID=A0ABQ5BFP5_9ASTR